MTAETNDSGELAPMNVTPEPPGRGRRDYRALPDAGVYLSVEERPVPRS